MFEKNSICGKANVTFADQFTVKELNIVESEKGKFVSFPNYKTKSGDYNDICYPITAKCRNDLVGVIMKNYEAALFAKEQQPDNEKINNKYTNERSENAKEQKPKNNTRH